MTLDRFDCSRNELARALEAVDLLFVGYLEDLLFGFLDDDPAVGGVIVGVRNDLAGNPQQTPPDARTLDDSRVVLDVCAGGNRGGEGRHIGRPAASIELSILAKLVDYREKVDDLPSRKEVDDRLEYLSVGGLVEVVRSEELKDHTQ